MYKDAESISLLCDINIDMFVALKIAFNSRELCHPNASNGSAKASNESSARRSCCKKKIET